MKVEISVNGWQDPDKLLCKFLSIAKTFKTEVVVNAANRLREIMQSGGSYPVHILEEERSFPIFKGAQRMIIGPGGMNNVIEIQEWNGEEWIGRTTSHPSPLISGNERESAVLESVKQFLQSQPYILQ